MKVTESNRRHIESVTEPGQQENSVFRLSDSKHQKTACSFVIVATWRNNEQSQA